MEKNTPPPQIRVFEPGQHALAGPPRPRPRLTRCPPPFNSFMMLVFHFSVFVSHFNFKPLKMEGNLLNTIFNQLRNQEPEIHQTFMIWQEKRRRLTAERLQASPRGPKHQCPMCLEPRRSVVLNAN